MVIANSTAPAYLGLLPTWNYDFQFAVNLDPPPTGPIRSIEILAIAAGTALLAAPLILTVFSSRRWRGNAQPTTNAYDAAPVYPTTVPSAAPSYPDTVPSAAPSYSPGSGLSASTYEPPVYVPPTYPAPFPAGGAQPAGDETQRTGLM